MFNRKVKIFLISFFVCVSSLFAQYNSGNWYIAKIKSDKIINENEIYGPYETLETTIATWLYSNIKEDSKYCICKNYSFTTKKPSTFYRSQYTVVYNDFLNDKEAAANKYNVDTEVIIGKKSKSKKTNTEQAGTIKTTYEASDKNVAESQLQAEETVAEEPKTQEVAESTENSEEKTVEENSADQPEAPQIEEKPVEITEQVQAETKAEEKPVEVKPAESPAIQQETPKEPETSENKPYTFEIDKKASVSRYKKEYLQDFVPEEIVEPVDDSGKNPNLIENPDEKDINGRTMLMIAAKSGNDWQIKNLLESNANVNLQDNDGWTALMYAVRYQESTSIIKSLLDAKADVKIINNFDSSALTLAACYNNNPEILNLILDYYSISEKEVIKAFVMLLSSKQASEYVEIAKVNLFLQRSVPLNSLYNGKTPLMYAAQYGNYTSILKLLLDNSSLPGMRSSEGKTAFDYATDNKVLIHDDIYWSLNRK